MPQLPYSDLGLPVKVKLARFGLLLVATSYGVPAFFASGALVNLALRPDFYQPSNGQDIDPLNPVVIMNLAFGFLRAFGLFAYVAAIRDAASRRVGIAAAVLALLGTLIWLSSAAGAVGWLGELWWSWGGMVFRIVVVTCMLAAMVRVAHSLGSRPHLLLAALPVLLCVAIESAGGPALTFERRLLWMTVLAGFHVYLTGYVIYHRRVIARAAHLRPSGPGSPSIATSTAP